MVYNILYIEEGMYVKHCLVIYNPNSGKKNKANFTKEMLDVFAEYGYEANIVFTEYAGHATKLILEVSNVDLVISIGGDGTFNEIMTGNFMRDKRLVVSHIPLGTANDIGAMYGFGKNIISNLRLVLEGEIKKVDICLINNHPFVYVAGFGKFVNISYQTPRDMKKRFGYLAYLIEGLKEFQGKTKLYDLDYEVNGERFSGKYSFILVSNANRIAGIDNFYKSIKLDDNCFEVLFCELNTKTDILKSLYHLATKDITKVPGFSFYKTNSLKIHFKNTPKNAWSIDGEEFSTFDELYEISLENNVELLLPKKNIKTLFMR